MSHSLARLVRAVVFDLGGVLVDWDPRYLYRTLFSDEAEMEAFLRDVCSPGWNLEQDRGRPFARAIRELQAQHPQYAAAIAAYFERWPEMLAGPIHESVAILAELRERGLPLYALTNWSAETFPYARERFDFLAWFADIVVSGREGVVKPDAAIFRLLVERNRLDPASTLFIDDHPANVAGARVAGLQAIRFRSPAELRRDLEALGLLVPASLRLD